MSRVYKTIAPYSRWTCGNCGYTLSGDFNKFCPGCGERLDWKSPIETNFRWKSFDGKFYGIAAFGDSIEDKCNIDGHTYRKEEEREMTFKIGEDTYKLPYEVFSKIFKKYLED